MFNYGLHKEFFCFYTFHYSSSHFKSSSISEQKGLSQASLECTRGSGIHMQVMVSCHLYSFKYILTCELPSLQHFMFKHL